MDDDLELDEELDSGAGEDESDDEVLNPPPQRGARTKKKKKSANKGAAKIDPAQALAFVRSRIASEKDPLIKAFYERELPTLQQSIKTAEADRRARLSIPVNGGSAKIGTHVFEVTNSQRYGGGKPALIEYIVTAIFEQKEAYGSRGHTVANLRRVRGTGDTRIESGQYRSNNVYLNPRSAADHALNDAKRRLVQAEREMEAARSKHDALTEIRAKAPEKPPAPTPISQIAKTAKPKKAKPAARAAGRVAAKEPSVRHGKRWTDEENAQLRALVAEGKTPEEIGAQIGRPRDRVVRQMHKLGIKPATTPFRDFKAERDDESVHENQTSLLEPEPELAGAPI